MPIIETLKPPGFVLRVSIHKKNPRKISIAIVVARFSNTRYKKCSASNSKSLFFVVQLYGWQNIINILPHPPNHYQQIPDENSEN